MAKAKRRAGSAAPITFAKVRRLALAFPGAEEGSSYGTPAIKVSGKLFVRLHQDGDAIVVRIDPADRAMRMRADPATFFITDHYTAYALMLVRFAAADLDDLCDLIEESWRAVAPKRLVAEYDRERG